VKNPAAETAGRQKLNICFQCHSRLSGILPTYQGSQERFWTSQNDRNKELRQRLQGVIFIKSLLTSLFLREEQSPLWQRGVRGDFLNNVNSILKLLISGSGKVIATLRLRSFILGRSLRRRSFNKSLAHYFCGIVVRKESGNN
jgi:hypothetical protein